MKTIFITGASSGIGKATAKLFQAKGWKVVATMRTPEKETELTALDNVIILPLDVTKDDQIQSTVQSAISLGDIDVVLNNAGHGLFGPVEAVNEQQILKQVNTNFLGPLKIIQAFIPYFREKKGGLFINTTSMAGLTGFPLSNVYNATKWALEGLSECLSIELSMFGIGVKTVSPDATKTNLFTSADVVSHPLYDNVIQKMIGGIQQSGESIDIAEVIFIAATDGKDTLRYPAGGKAQQIYARRLEIGPEASRIETTKWFLGL
ncbi:SDR family oxidoreductase [Olivibacter domesticus]|uniref:NADP-dependent 3-hydroxy acid dehydrogenase YdfG n=1 Tax=Olivibacter domesticus TaxID=407022 RepID=A0A1H7MXC9_OLID1|nr:SDR family oxidoreductase [Olivibacter domesticus]SEL15873.1 NADP-dependent 3-hydroxy acid dehydrogenase YdfG [Olivibacter domesticus]